MYYVYVLKSDAHDRIYIGFSNDVDMRLKQHNAGKTKSTKAYRPWKLIHTEEFPDRVSARKREKQIQASGYIRSALKGGKYRSHPGNGHAAG
jgi:putative endonuclease